MKRLKYILHKYIDDQIYPNSTYNPLKVLRVLVGNKIDRDDHEIPADVGEDFANRHGMYFLQTSAKSCDNVDRLFTEIAHELLQQVKIKYRSVQE